MPAHRCSNCGRSISVARTHLPCPRCGSLDRHVYDHDEARVDEGPTIISSTRTFYRWQPGWLAVAVGIAVLGLALGAVNPILGLVSTPVLFVAGLFTTPRLVERYRERREVP